MEFPIRQHQALQTVGGTSMNLVRKLIRPLDHLEWEMASTIAQWLLWIWAAINIITISVWSIYVASKIN